MARLPPYQFGIWLAEYLYNRCQLCHIQRSMSHANIASASTASTAKPTFALFNSGLLCEHCQHSISWLPDPFSVDIASNLALPIQAATFYDYPIRQAFRSFKHSEDITKLPLLVHVLRQLPRPTGCNGSNSVIVPMPTTDNRLRQRGFDPVTILSSYLAKHWQIPLWRGVVRIDSTVSQQGLTRSERLANLDDAFRVTELPPVKRLLLFDDIATTGASLQALARALYETVDAQYGTNTSSDSANTNSHNHRFYAYALAHGSN
ncbi:ComF family protein [Psychrobacter sp. M13]|uniref:ComF family protein n=1 Tax=Psychrobacter sp. M13 TaxID=3067275 RepID=UPI00273B8F06|nr:ComF family protein [Psychrobacter sp. M13]WLP94837.1 ComF family protein [Psychrobacter sp. M13]